MNHKGSSFLSGVLLQNGTFFFAKQGDKYAQEDKPNSTFFAYDASAEKPWKKLEGPTVPWPAIDMTFVGNEENPEAIMAIGPKGQTWVYSFDEQEADQNSVASKFFARGIRNIAGRLFAFGMGYRCYELVEDGDRWEDISAPADQSNIAGFEDLAGDINEIYCVGWKGDLWRRMGSEWTQIASPAHHNFSSITKASDGNFYAVGAKGLFVRGRGDQWEVIETSTSQTFQDVLEFEKQIYLNTDLGLFTYREGSIIPVTDFEAAPATFLSLHKNDQQMISMGPYDLQVKTGNSTWLKIV